MLVIDNLTKIYANTSDEIFKVATQFTPQIVPADRVSVALLTELGDSLQMYALKDETDFMPVGPQVPVEGTLLGQVIKE